MLSPPELLRKQDFAVQEFAAQGEGAALSPSRKRCVLWCPRKSSCPPKSIAELPRHNVLVCLISFLFALEHQSVFVYENGNTKNIKMT